MDELLNWARSSFANDRLFGAGKKTPVDVAIGMLRLSCCFRSLLMPRNLLARVAGEALLNSAELS